MSFLRLIFFPAVVSLYLLVPSPILPHPRFSAYIFSGKLVCLSEDLSSFYSSCSWCFSRFAGALPNFGFSQLTCFLKYVLLTVYLLSRCCFSRFAGALNHCCRVRSLSQGHTLGWNAMVAMHFQACFLHVTFMSCQKQEAFGFLLLWPSERRRPTSLSYMFLVSIYKNSGGPGRQ